MGTVAGRAMKLDQVRTLEALFLCYYF